MLIEDVVQIGNGEKSHAISTVTSVFCFDAFSNEDPQTEVSKRTQVTINAPNHGMLKFEEILKEFSTSSYLQVVGGFNSSENSSQLGNLPLTRLKNETYFKPNQPSHSSN